jgi:hypothetical protein
MKFLRGFEIRKESNRKVYARTSVHSFRLHENIKVDMETIFILLFSHFNCALCTSEVALNRKVKSLVFNK